ncbi:MAG: LysR family transcriptional regulator [Myxococcota bacterium]
MSSDPPETTELQAFVSVVESGSVASAARELNVPRATISRRLARLEERLEVRLLHRTTRKQGLTDAGEELFRHARSILAAVSEAEDAMRHRDGTPRGLLRVSLPPGDAMPPRLITDFLAEHPEVQVEVELTTRYVDLVAEGFDVALRAGSTPLEPGLIARRLRTTRSSVWASPRYLEAHGTPTTPANLAQHTCILGFAKGVRPVTHWPLIDGGQVRVTGRLVTNDLRTITHACAQGLGLAMLPDAFTTNLGATDLVRVLEDSVGACGHMSIVYTEREFMPAAVRAFVDHLVRWHDTFVP